MQTLSCGWPVSHLSLTARGRELVCSSLLCTALIPYDGGVNYLSSALNDP